MTTKPTIADRIRDDVALVDSTHQGALMLLHILRKRRDAATDELERDCWQAPIDVPNEADRAVRRVLPKPPLRILALQDRWIAEINQLRADEPVP
ncbi:hypothetical protein L1785_18745 [Antribacter sp. KLBMP9083]|uniref:Uncharacterized protein n=1 Tax=Antribacter soli TaxID=2910976 RepID=A0AA41QGG7_9MICO|nr:hypothetical protein [Antribacter soli]MCF4123018.1 hypothetical protein [Antribacter soli]